MVVMMTMMGRSVLRFILRTESIGRHDACMPTRPTPATLSSSSPLSTIPLTHLQHLREPRVGRALQDGQQRGGQHLAEVEDAVARERRQG